MISNILIRFVQKYPFFLLIPCVFFNRKKKTIHKNPIHKDAEFTWDPSATFGKNRGRTFSASWVWCEPSPDEQKIGSNSPGVLDLLGGYGEVVSLKRTYFFAPEIYGFLKRKGLASFATNFQGRKMLVSGRLSPESSRFFFPGKDWDVCTLDTQDFARLVRCSRKETTCLITLKSKKSKKLMFEAFCGICVINFRIWSKNTCLGELVIGFSVLSLLILLYIFWWGFAA